MIKDLRGIACPMSFVKTKLTLESMSPEEILDVLLDKGDVLRDVREAVADDGHEIVSEEIKNDYGQLKIRRKP